MYASEHDRDISPDLKGAMSIKHFCREYDLGRSYVYELISTGKLRAVKSGSRTLILKRDAAAWAASLPAVQAA